MRLQYEGGLALCEGIEEALGQEEVGIYNIYAMKSEKFSKLPPRMVGVVNASVSTPTVQDRSDFMNEDSVIVTCQWHPCRLTYHVYRVPSSNEGFGHSLIKKRRAQEDRMRRVFAI
jgi:hypothetical protein